MSNICPYCAGSGEGHHENYTCRACCGRGVTTSPDDYYELNELIDELLAEIRRVTNRTPHKGDKR